MNTGNRIQAVIFDMDGVLTDSEPIINAAAVAMFKELGLTVQPEDFLPFVGTGEDRYIGGVAEKYQFTIDLPTAKKRTYEIYLDLVPTRLQAFPGATELVRSCKAAGLKVAVASSADRIKVTANLNQIGLPPHEWDAIVTGEDVVRKKPAPDIFLAAAQKLGVEPSHAVVVEDAVHGVEAAKAAGMRCVAVAQSFPAEQLSAADLVKQKIGDLTVTELLGATVATPPVQPPPLPFADGSAKATAQTHEPWGFWATVGFAVIIALAFIVTQTVVMVVFALATSDPNRLGETIQNLQTSGLFWGLATAFTAPVATGLTFLFAHLRRRATGIALSDYLGIRLVGGKTLLRCGAGIVLLIVVSDLVTTLLNRPVVPEVMIAVYRSAGFTPLLWVALVVLAPVSEEIFFRGFLIPGLQRSVLGIPGAIIVTSAAWALIHVQYDAYGIGIIFVTGLVLGWVRIKTNSVIPCILMHSIMNIIATVQTALAVAKANSGG